MAKNGIIPLIRKETYTTTGTTVWGATTSKEVGVINVPDESHIVVFNSNSYPGTPGDTVLVVNSDIDFVTILIQPSPFGDGDTDGYQLRAGATIGVIYHEENGWMFMGTLIPS